MADIEKIAEAIISGDAPQTSILVQESLDAGESPEDILTGGMIAGMAVIGDRFKKNEIYVPEVLIAARAMKSGMEVLKPILVEKDVKPKAIYATGTVKGDLHDIGKNLVMMMMEGAGYHIMDLGVDVAPEKFVQAINDGANIIGMSALLTTTMPSMKKTIEAISEAGMRDTVKVMIGGAPVTAEYAEQIGADGYAANATSAVELANSLLDV